MKNGFEISEQTYAFYKDGDEAVEIAQCHPGAYCVRAPNGVYRAPLPPLSDRDFPSFDDVEDAIIARLDGDVPSDDELELMGYDDLFDLDFEDDQEHTSAWLAALDNAPAPRVTRSIPSADLPAGIHPVIVRRPTRSLDAVREDDSPQALSSRTAVMQGPKVVLKETGPDDHSWKGNTKNGRQHARHH